MTVPAATLFAEARFRHAWRPYQARVLETLDEHMDDDHLHVVAPPGSGKTVLGLEVIRRIGRPALVLVPTITIREQWLHRLKEDFLAPGTPLAGFSGKVTEPGLLTVTTYQGLYSQFKAVGASALIQTLQAHGVATLAVDEAHHLRAQWWRCLDEVKQGLAMVKVVALTGTPPYDAPKEEWNRYAAFCGPVDEEIGVPELVLDGNLCPHQDLVYLCQPATDELAQLRDYQTQVDGLVRDLAIDTKLAQLEDRLRGIGALERRHVHLRQTKPNQRLLKSGRGLLRGINRIVELDVRVLPGPGLPLHTNRRLVQAYRPDVTAFTSLNLS